MRSSTMPQLSAARSTLDRHVGSFQGPPGHFDRGRGRACSLRYVNFSSSRLYLGVVLRLPWNHIDDYGNQCTLTLSTY